MLLCLAGKSLQIVTEAMVSVIESETSARYLHIYQFENLNRKLQFTSYKNIGLAN